MAIELKQQSQTSVYLDEDKIDLIKRTVCKGATNDELDLFVMACKKKREKRKKKRKEIKTPFPQQNKNVIPQKEGLHDVKCERMIRSCICHSDIKCSKTQM